jgi:hypothetical protein
VSLLLALVTYLSESKNLSYRRFLKLNQDTIIASLISLTSSNSLTSDKWENFDTAWYKRFLEEAKRLLDSDTFIELKKKVCLFFLFCKIWVTPNTPRSHLSENYCFDTLGNHPKLSTQAP